MKVKSPRMLSFLKRNNIYLSVKGTGVSDFGADFFVYLVEIVVFLRFSNILLSM